MSAASSAVDLARSRLDESQKTLEELLRIPSISTLPEYKPDMGHAAQWLVDRLNGMGFDHVEILPTKGHPIVVGELRSTTETAPTILVYGHYDVQPSDPDELWHSPAFKPTVRGEHLYARGASDMKGQVVAYLEAVRAMVDSGNLPVNLRCMFEGEEEVGSPNLLDFIHQHRNRLEADLCLNLDSSILSPQIPAITYALRGLAYFEIRLQGAETDLHSGRFGGVVDNPAQVLSHILAGMKDPQGTILLPHFYDKVRPITEEEREDLERLPQNDEWWKEQAGTDVLFGEPGYSTIERSSARPTLDINGILSGFTGEGSKTVLPAKAMAKVSMRLVPDQDPEEIETHLITYLNENVPATMTWELINHSSSPPGLMERDSDAVQAAKAAFMEVWGEEPIFTREGGTVPVVGHIKQELGLDSLMLGFGLPDDNLHAPDEKLHMPTFNRGVEVYIHFAHHFAGQ
jgi:acetylornithine deacetylase/succinyl-diaminopimelate desuccinylase-like protein